MKRGMCLLFAGLCLVFTVAKPAAQTATLSADLMKDWKAQKETMMRIADAMPEDKFGYKSTPPQRSWGEQILHVAGANMFLMRFLNGKTPAPAVNTADLVVFGLKASTKAEYLKALNDSFDYGEALLKEFSDAALTETVNGPPWVGPATRVRMAYYVIAHCQDIYGQMAVYLRLNGLVPPASRRGGV
jgi:uncharacterized damage-inducible protein DinB